MHAANILVFIPKKKRANNTNKRDKDLLHSYCAELVFDYPSLCIYK